MAVKTQFLMAEAYFELAKEHRKLDKKEMAIEEMAIGKEVLEDALRDYPQSEYLVQGRYLLASLAQQMGEVNREMYEELKKNEGATEEEREMLKLEMEANFTDAMERFTAILSQFPDSEYAPRAQFNKAVCLERKEDYNAANAEYVKVTYLYPDHELVPKAIARMGNHFFSEGKYQIAAQVFYKFQERYPDHEVAPKALVLAGQSYMKMEMYEAAIKVLVTLKDDYEDKGFDDTRAEGMYWLAKCYEKVRDYENAYYVFKKITWDHPTTKWAKASRGRLTEKVYARMDE
jgi:TolA-binding protein